MTSIIRLLALSFGALAMTAAAIPAQAQFRSLLRDGSRGAQQAETCDKGSTGNAGRGAIAGMLGGAANRLARRAGIPSFAPVAELTDQLSLAIACVLDPKEQEQAANATLEATRGNDDGDDTVGPIVGQSASWTSSSRNNVSGTSTVTAREAVGDDMDCITVTDVAIVEGEETSANKRMCRPPGSARYSIVA